MAEEIRQTPVPLPTYGQPASGEASTAGTPALTVEQPSATDTTMSTAPVAATSVAATSVVTTPVAVAPAPTTEQAPSPAPATTTTTTTNAIATSNAPSPAAAAAPARTGTPLRNMNGQDNNSSRAASQHPDSGFTMPAEAPPHGAPVRQYLNSTVTVPLLDGMKLIAKDRPKDPLRVLGEYLIQRSKELEASSA
ncbi:hypothetical protein F4820DRAFT_409803 [Hypoxylon rubiginosum]|uniref:Uncharacterized protein n=1 Tax=Hypoxylon rubiginosum TaxID=110542 RepID=A0ACB9ZBS0_9PEZI|nr:hypothetical protein F4820DRAFT_409803 [Hypoxylon rubiginosum]